MPRVVQLDRELVQMRSGESLWRRCECGKWVSKETGDHVELVTLTLSQMMKRFERQCPEKTEKDTEPK